MDAAMPVFRCLGGHTHATEELARKSSKVFLIHDKAIELLAPNTHSVWNSPTKDAERSRVVWFINNKDKILAAYEEALEYAEEKMACSMSQ